MNSFFLGLRGLCVVVLVVVVVDDVTTVGKYLFTDGPGL